MPVSIELSRENVNRSPGNKVCRGFRIESSVLVQHVLVHHDIVCKRCAGRLFGGITIGSVHDSGKAVKFSGIANDIATSRRLGRGFRRNGRGKGHCAQSTQNANG